MKLRWLSIILVCMSFGYASYTHAWYYSCPDDSSSSCRQRCDNKAGVEAQRCASKARRDFERCNSAPSRSEILYCYQRVTDNKKTCDDFNNSFKRRDCYSDCGCRTSDEEF